MSSGYIKLKKQRAKAKKLKEEQAQAKTRARQLAQRQANTQKKLDVIRKEKAVESAKRLLLRNILLPSIPSPSTRALKTSDGASPSKSPTRLLRTSDGGYYTGETDEKSRRDGYGCRYYKNGALLYRGSYKVTGREKKKSLLWLLVVVLTFGCLCCGGCCVGCCVGCCFVLLVVLTFVCLCVGSLSSDHWLFLEDTISRLWRKIHHGWKKNVSRKLLRRSTFRDGTRVESKRRIVRRPLEKWSTPR